jgi:hypothetical protein
MGDVGAAHAVGPARAGRRGAQAPQVVLPQRRAALTDALGDLGWKNGRPRRTEMAPVRRFLEFPKAQPLWMVLA